jgi:hypothetical protein
MEAGFFVCEWVILFFLSAIFYTPLFCFFVGGMLSATRAVFRHFQSLGVVLLVLLGVIVAFLALCAREGNLVSHILCGTSYNYLTEKTDTSSPTVLRR